MAGDTLVADSGMNGVKLAAEHLGLQPTVSSSRSGSATLKYQAQSGRIVQPSGVAVNSFGVLSIDLNKRARRKTSGCLHYNRQYKVIMCDKHGYARASWKRHLAEYQHLETSRHQTGCGPVSRIRGDQAGARNTALMESLYHTCSPAGRDVCAKERH